MDKTAELARRYLALPHYTAFRRQTGQPVKLKLLPMTEVSSEACASWANYKTPQNYRNREWRQSRVLSLDVARDCQRFREPERALSLELIGGLVDVEQPH